MRFFLCLLISFFRVVCNSNIIKTHTNQYKTAWAHAHSKTKTQGKKTERRECTFCEVSTRKRRRGEKNKSVTYIFVFSPAYRFA